MAITAPIAAWRRTACRASNPAAPSAPARRRRSCRKCRADCGRRRRCCRRRPAPRSSFSSARRAILIFLLPGLISSSTSCSRIAIARARGGTLASVRSTARSACRRSNCASALALSALVTILSRSFEEVFLSTVASLAAKRASRLPGSPTANTSVSEFFSQIRPPQTVATVRIKVSAANSSTCRRLLLTTREREGGSSAGGLGLQRSWLIPAARTPVRRHNGSEGRPTRS